MMLFMNLSSYVCDILNPVFNEFKQLCLYVCDAELAKSKTNDVNEVIADTKAVAHDKVTLADDWWQCSGYFS